MGHGGEPGSGLQRQGVSAGERHEHVGISVVPAAVPRRGWVVGNCRARPTGFPPSTMGILTPSLAGQGQARASEATEDLCPSAHPKNRVSPGRFFIYFCFYVRISSPAGLVESKLMEKRQRQKDQDADSWAASQHLASRLLPLSLSLSGSLAPRSSRMWRGDSQMSIPRPQGGCPFLSCQEVGGRHSGIWHPHAGSAIQETPLPWTPLILAPRGLHQPCLGAASPSQMGARATVRPQAVRDQATAPEGGPQGHTSRHTDTRHTHRYPHASLQPHRVHHSTNWPGVSTGTSYADRSIDSDPLVLCAHRHARMRLPSRSASPQAPAHQLGSRLHEAPLSTT